MVHVRLTETYDLSTQVNKMGIIGIHTPSTSQITKVWGNVLKSHQRMRFVGCDVTVACASMLPADPLQIGTEAGDIAPQDMFNPILYRAVSNDSYNTLTSRIYALNPAQSVANTQLGTVVREDLATGTVVDAFNVYYSLLADPDGWRKAMPQAGLEMKGLYPIVYQLVNTYGNTTLPVKYVNPSSGAPDPITDGMQMELEAVGYNEESMSEAPDTDFPKVNTTDRAYTFRGPSMRMPSVPTEAIMRWEQTVGDETLKLNLLGDFEIPPTYVACIITPPAKLNRLYYRMKVTWTIEFTGIRSDLESSRLYDLGTIGSQFYGSDYADQSSKMDTVSSSVDVKDAEIDLVMTSTR